MTKETHGGTDATDNKAADDAFLAACSALLIAMAGGPVLGNGDILALLDAMPDARMKDHLAAELRCQPWTDMR